MVNFMLDIKKTDCENIPSSVTNHSAWRRLKSLIHKYQYKSNYCARWCRRIRLAQIIIAVLIPIISHLDTNLIRWLIPIAGAFIALLEGIQHMNQYSNFRISYHITAESLKHEQFLFLASAGPYKEQTETQRLTTLSERIESMIPVTDYWY